MYLLLPLPPFDNIIDNLTTKKELKYAEVNVRLIEMSTRQRNDTSNTSTAYFGNSNSVKEKGIKECTLCKKNGDNCIGHVFNNCRKLQKYKNKEKERFYDNANIAAISHEFLPEIISSETTFNKAFAVPSSTSSDWILDSGCSTCMTSRQDLLHYLNPHQGVVNMANGNEIPVNGVGSVWLICITSAGNFEPVKLEFDGYKIYSQSGRRKLFRGNKERIYAEVDASKQFVIRQRKIKVSFSSYLEAHECFGHPGENIMSTLKSKYANLIPNKPEDFHCPACIFAKLTHKSETSRPRRYSKPFEIIHYDLSGKFSVESLSGKSYYISFIDDHFP
ncbi:hypothetical protein EPUL_006222 [Erysiphe pulchra]|uniref:Retrovirus-related Pol polyprotein from transposon TNT 1-94-like beta-barrel domain-containing protein n=1 Tax=Erysiphe pulchra TaxID=225359 RepID=A0A2S4PJE2_9PEZI|nr:hypothetical protein EPUL_006222 [Erysiphe pulchra]